MNAPTRSPLLWLSLSALFAACSDDPPVVGGDAGNPKPDAPADAAPDVADDVAAPDVSMDAQNDLGADVAPDAEPDVAVDAAPDAEPDVAPDAEPDAVEDVAPDLPPPCAVTETRCGERCVDVQTDGSHCGACGNTCGATTTCRGGMCVPTCGAAETLCGAPARCVNTQTDGDHCGACGTVCPAGQVCGAGACADLQTDRANCGRCNAACAAGQSCTAGACACAAGLTLCGADCVNTMTDTVHCGSCATACGVGQVCTNSRCESTACPVAASCAGPKCPRCARVAFAEDWESGVTAWHDPSNRGPITATTDTSGCRGSFVRETVRVGGGRIYSLAGTPVTAGRTYCASSWIRGSAGTWPFVGIRSSNAAGALGNEHWLIGQPCFGTGIAGTVAPVTSDGAWRWYGREFVMPAYTHVVIELEIWDGGAVGTADFDQVQLIEGPCPPAPTTACAAATCSM